MIPIEEAGNNLELFDGGRIYDIQPNNYSKKKWTSGNEKNKKR